MKISKNLWLTIGGITIYIIVIFSILISNNVFSDNHKYITADDFYSNESNWMLNNSAMENKNTYGEFKLSGNISRSKDLVFLGDKVIFEDGNLSVSWTDDGLLEYINFSSFDNLVFILGNKTYRYTKEVKDER